MKIIIVMLLFGVRICLIGTGMNSSSDRNTLKRIWL